MNKKDILKRLDSTIGCFMAHPDNEPNSEFADRIDDLLEIKQTLTISTISNRKKLLIDFRNWWYGNRHTGNTITNDEIDSFLDN